MEYKGIEYSIVQTADPTGFKWTVQLDAARTRTGVAYSRVEAISTAQRAIDKALPKGT
jgi:hypothetical protein